MPLGSEGPEEADFPFSHHFRGERKAESLWSSQENLPAAPLAQPTREKVTQPSPKTSVTQARDGPHC